MPIFSQCILKDFLSVMWTIFFWAGIKYYKRVSMSAEDDHMPQIVCHVDMLRARDALPCLKVSTWTIQSQHLDNSPASYSRSQLIQILFVYFNVAWGITAYMYLTWVNEVDLINSVAVKLACWISYLLRLQESLARLTSSVFSVPHGQLRLMFSSSFSFQVLPQIN